MKRIFVTADLHLYHKNIITFTDENGILQRPFSTFEEHDEFVIDNFNSVVTNKNDKVYILGDVLINKKGFPLLERLNGDKVLIKGNHDIFDIKLYLQYFRDIRAYHVMNRVIMSHIPIHECQKKRFKRNIHGHMHELKMNDPWYRCVSLEQTNMKPVPYEELIEGVNNEG